MSDDYNSLKSQALQQLEENNAKEAFQSLRFILSYPGMMSNDKRWTEAMEMFARVGEQLAGDKFAQLALAAAKRAKDPQVLYDFGYELIEVNLPEIAATVLHRANDVMPGSAKILAEYVTALEMGGWHNDACKAITAQQKVMDSNFMLQYLFAYNSIMAGRIEDARKVLPRLRSDRDERHVYMCNAIEGMVQRADAVKSFSSLNHQDLRGWHFVINGSFLTHISPHGFDEGMNGRYAFVQDSNARCKEGLLKLQAVLKECGLAVPRVYVLPNREDTILAIAAGKIFNAPLVEWTGEDAQPGLIVAYDTGMLHPEVQKALTQHQPGQILYSHALCWTEPPAFAPDVVTFMFQSNIMPWEGGLRVNKDTNAVERAPVDERASDQLAEEIVSATLEEDDLEDLEELIKFCRVAVTTQVEHGPFLKTGQRRRMRRESPVGSSRFL